jgi:malonyl-CoA/methylmalonyl-CoA synthetase
VNEIKRAASLLKEIGIRKGDRVAFQLPKSMEFLFLHLGNLSVGGVTLPLNTAYKGEEIEYILSNSQSSLFITQQDNYLDLKPIIRSMKNLKCLVTDREVSGEFFYQPEVKKIDAGQELDFPAQDDDVAMICYTSGTTGQSKGAMITHRNLVENTQALKKSWEWTEQDLLLHVLPLFHVHGLVVALHGGLNVGCTIVMHEKFQPERVWKTIEEKRCTMFMGVPTMYHRLLLAWKEMREKPDLSSMRVFISGSAPLPEKIFYDFRETTGHTILERYGTTETIMNTSNLIEESGRKAKSVGYPLPGVEIRIMSEDGKDVEPGKVGEVWIKGNNVCKGYWQMPEKTEESFVGPWYKSGDLGYQDPDDGMRLYLVGRSKELIISGGYNVYPKEVEDVLERHEAVADSAVIGLPDEDFGERVTAVVVKKGSAPSASAEELIDFCKQKLASYKCPKNVFFRNQLPRNAMGKIQKNQLQKEYSK